VYAGDASHKLNNCFLFDHLDTKIMSEDSSDKTQQTTYSTISKKKRGRPLGSIIKRAKNKKNVTARAS